MPDDRVAKVEIAFDDGPMIASPTWTDVTQYNVSGSTKMGRSYELDRFAVGVAQIVMRTVGARLFDPEYTTGTYYGKLTPMRQIRITKTYNAVTYNVFRGFITDWGQTVPDADNVFVTTISAMDGLGALEKIQLPSSAWALVVQNADPTCWMRLGESDTPRITDSSDNGNYGLYDNVNQGAPGLVPNDADGAIDVGVDYDPADSRATIQNPTLLTGYPITISALIRLATETQYSRTLTNGIVNPSVASGELIVVVDWSGGIAPVGTLRSSLYKSDGVTRRTIRTAIQVDDNRVHHVALVYTSSTDHKVYIDGVDQTVVVDNNTVTWDCGNVVTGWTIGNTPDVAWGTFGFRGIIDEFCAWNGTALSSGTIASHSLAAKTGWAGDDTGARVDRFLTAIGWPSLLRNINTGISVLGSATWSTGETALSVLQALADTEYGYFFAGPDGKIVWYSRHYRYLNTKATTSQATFGDTRSGEALKYVADGFELHRDEALIRNPVQASRAGGVAITVRDQTLIDSTYGPNNWSAPPTQDALDSAVLDRATWLLARYKTAATRLRAMTLIPKSNPTGLWPKALGLGIGDRITVKRKPLGIGNTISVDQWIEGISHEFTADIWRTTFTASPVETQAYLVLDDASLGLLNTGVLSY